MAKRKKVVQAGALVMATIYTPAMPQDAAHVRAEKLHASTQARRLMNMKVARRRLEMLLAGNFTASDLHMTFTYRDECLPPTRAAALKRIRAFLAELRKHRRARGQPLVYVYVTEGRHGDKRLHHHAVLNAAGHDLEVIRSLWTHGGVDLEYIGDREYSGLASYITKETVEEGKPVGAQMWTASRNVRRPSTETTWVGDDETLTPPPGSYVLERREEQTEFGGFVFLKYRLLAVKPRKTRPPRAKRGCGAPNPSDLNPCISLGADMEKTRAGGCANQKSGL